MNVSTELLERVNTEKVLTKSFGETYGAIIDRLFNYGVLKENQPLLNAILGFIMSNTTDYQTTEKSLKTKNCEMEYQHTKQSVVFPNLHVFEMKVHEDDISHIYSICIGKDVDINGYYMDIDWC